MPPLSDYTPFESLLFFQSLAALGARPVNFSSISDGLRSNPFVRHHVAFNADRLSPEALEDLYATLTRDGFDSVITVSPEQNGNPKKRKISSPRPDGLDEDVAHARIFPDLVSHLYAKYKDLVTREIIHEEKRYKDIRDEIERLKKEEQPAPVPAPVQAAPPTPQVKQDAKPAPAPVPMDLDVKEEKPQGKPPKDAEPAEPTPPSVQKPRAERPKDTTIPKQPEKVVSPDTAHKHQPPPIQPAKQPQGQAEHALQQQQPSQLPPEPQPTPHTTGLPPQQPVNGKTPLAPQPSIPAPNKTPTTEQPPVSKPPQASTPAAPVAPSPTPIQTPAVPPSIPQTAKQPTPSSAPPKQPAKSTPKESPSVPAPVKVPPQAAAQPSFQQWHLNPSPSTPRPSAPSQAPSKHPTPAAAGRPIPPPFPQNQPDAKPYQGPYLPAAPITPVPGRSALPSPALGYETPVPAAQALFSESRASRGPRLSIETPGSATPWKRTPRLSIPQSPGSPPRPRPEDVSPISERAPSIEPPEPTVEESEPRRRKRRAEEKADVDKKPPSSTKAEKPTYSRKRRAPSTTSSRSRGRSVLSRDEESPADSHRKIKHEMPSTPAGISEVAESDSQANNGRKGQSQTEDRLGRGRPKRKRGASEALEPETPHAELSRLDPTQHVLCTRNFPRTGAPIMNDVTMHKHASIFTKPLTERDAPGYRDLIYRPQDLKTIKSMIHQGSKGVSAATEAATPAADGESPAPGAGTPSKNAVLILQKTEDIIPPKGIVNSAQLEKELIRMFANAIMFNPIPQRGFGPAFRMISESGSRESTQAPETDEGGIIKDTQEMFEDVEQAVTRWRAAERTADELASKSILSLQRGGDLNTDSAYEVK